MPDFILTTIRRISFWLFWPALALVIWSEMVPMPPPFLRLVDPRAEHFIAYFVLALLATLGFRLTGKLALAIPCLLIMAGTLEWLQEFVERDYDLMNMIAKTLGIVAGLCLGAVFLTLVEPTPEDYPPLNE